MKSHNPVINTEIEILNPDGSLAERRVIGSPEYKAEYKVTTTLKSKEGEILEVKETPFRSFVDNWVYMWRKNLGEETNIGSIVDTAGANPAGETVYADVMAADDDDTYGIMVGQNSGGAAAIATSVSYDDYRLKNPHAHSAAAMDYEAMTQDTYSYGDNTIVFRRNFVNASAGTLTVKEVGLFGDMGTNYIMLARDTKDENNVALYVSMGAGQTLEVAYTITISTSGWITNNMMSMWNSCLTAGASLIRTTDGANASYDFSSNVAKMSIDKDNSTKTCGILLGTGGTTFSPSQIALTTPLDATDFSVGNTSIGSVTHPSWAAGAVAYSQFLVQRDITNTTSGNVTVRELGIYTTTDTDEYCMIARILTGSIVLTKLQTFRAKVTMAWPIFDDTNNAT